MTTTTTTQLAALATASEIDITTPQRRHAPPSNLVSAGTTNRRGQVTAGGHRYDLTFTTDRGKSSP